MPAARSVYTINHSCDKLSWTYNSRWKTSSQTSDLATLLIAEVTFLLQMITMLVGLEWCCVLLFLLKIMPGWKIIMEVFCVFIACVISCWVWSSPCCSHPTEDVIRPTLANAGEVLSCMEKKKTSNETLLLGQWECALAILTCIPCAHTGANIQHFIFFRDLKTCTHWANTASQHHYWDWDAITLKSRNLGWRSCLIDHSHTESCGKLGNGTYQWCCTTFHQGCWTLQQLLAHCFWADLREICSAAFISNPYKSSTVWEQTVREAANN